jgi:hypothetical protein
VPPERFVDSPTPVPSPDYAEDAVRADPAATDDPETATRPPSGFRATTSGPRWSIEPTPAGTREDAVSVLGGLPCRLHGPIPPPAFWLEITTGRALSMKRFPISDRTIKRLSGDRTASKLRESA